MTHPDYKQRDFSYLTVAAVAAVAASILLVAVIYISDRNRNQERDIFDGNRRQAVDRNDSEESQRAVEDCGQDANANTGAVGGVDAGQLQPCEGDAVAARRVTHARRFIVTAYCPCKKCCGPKACGITASGAPVSANGGRFLAAGRDIPFGTRISVPGYAGGQPVLVLDRGGAIKGGRLDVYFSSHQAALRWGRKQLVCEVMK